ncbi:MAG: transporter [Microbacteriaceae bacterium]|nr:transporter [Microbacteriaceae bacterium]
MRCTDAPFLLRKARHVPILSNRVAFWTAAFVVTLSIWASAAPTMIYPLYIDEWKLSTAVTSGIFATYPLALITAMLLFGGISDYIGRRTVLLIGIALVAIGILFFAIGPDVSWLFAGRVFQGAGVGIGLSAASAAMAEFEPNGNRDRASAINAIVSSFGMVLGSLVGGALVQYAPYPTRLAFFVLLALSVVTLGMLAMFPRNRLGTLAHGRWRPRGPVVPKGLGKVVLVASLAGATSYANGALVLGLGAEIARDLIKTDNALLAGSTIAVFGLSIGVTSLLLRNWPPMRPVIFGGILVSAAMVLLVVSSSMASLPLYYVTCLVAGVGNGMLFLSSISLVNRFAPIHHRAQTFATVYLVAYTFQGAVPFAAGVTATAIGLLPSLAIWGVVIIIIGLTTTVTALVVGPRLPWLANEPGTA